MENPCDKGPAIDAVRQAQQKLTFEQTAQSMKIDQVLENQKQLGTDIKQAIDGLTKIIMADIETRKDVEQLKKDREILFDLQRVDAAAIVSLQRLADQYKGAGIFDHFPILWNWYQQHEAAEEVEDEQIAAMQTRTNTVYTWYLGELGWRRFIPTAIAIIAGLLAIYSSVANFDKPANAELDHHHSAMK